MARPTSLDASPWLPAYGWWPRGDEYSVTVVLVPYHSAVDPDATFDFALRGYAGSDVPVWEHELTGLALDEQRAISLDELDIPEAPEHGGILEVHAVRTDRAPRHQVGFNAVWIDAHGVDGGGYLIPTVPMRAAAKSIARDDLQIVPGILAGSDVETELVLLNVSPETTEVRLVASSADGLVSEGRPLSLAPWSSWHGDLRARVPRLRRLLESSDGIGSLAIYSSHKILPFFGFRRDAQPVVSMDHAAPIFLSKRPMATVVVTLDDDPASLRGLLEAIAAQTQARRGKVEVLAVDVGADPAAAELARAHGARVHSIAPAEAARGTGLDTALAQGDYVLIADSRLRPADERWVSRLVEPLRRDEGLHVVYGRQVAHRRALAGEQRRLDRIFSDAERDPPRLDDCATTLETALLANAAIRRSALHALPVASSPVCAEARRRALLADRRVAYAPRARARHEQAATLRSVLRRAALAGRLGPRAAGRTSASLRAATADLRADLRALPPERRLLGAGAAVAFWLSRTAGLLAGVGRRQATPRRGR